MRQTMYALIYWKQFVSGPLAGLRVDAGLSYPNKRMANLIAKAHHVGKRGEDTLTGSKWEIDACSVQPMSRVDPVLRARHFAHLTRRA